ncbi:MAG: leucine-rich repeat protein [Alphaproteobacteria bacterium]|nr:leucine-rich repeat protein [Alphaproteobacteria bacterium]
MRKTIFISSALIGGFLSTEALAVSCPAGTTRNVDCWECGSNSACIATITTDGEGKKTLNILPGSTYIQNSTNDWLTNQWLNAIQDVDAINIASGVKNIGREVFKCASKVTEVVIPETVTSIQRDAFAETGLTNVTFSGTPQIQFLSGFGNIQSLTHLDIPDSVTWISSSAFSNSGLESIKLPANLTTIESSAFENSKIKELTIPNSVESIEAYAFANMPQLEKVTLPDNEKFTSIRTNLFNGSENLKEVNIPDSVKYIDEYAFQNCSSLESVSIPANLTSIGRNAFDGASSLTSLTFETDENGRTKLTTIPFAAFEGAAITSLTIPEGVTTIEKLAFGGATNLKTLVLPDSLNTIRGQAFYNTNVEEIFCHETSEGRCANFYSGYGSAYSSGKISTGLKTTAMKTYTIDGDGVYTLKDSQGNLSYFASINDMLKGSEGSCPSIDVCKAIISAAKNAPIVVNGKTYANLEDLKAGRYIRKRIYTVEEAEKVSKPTGNTFRLRYK